MSLVLAGFTLLICYLLYKFTARPPNFPPGPFNLPFIGYLPFLGKEHYKTFVQLGKKYGDIFSFNFGFKRMVVLNSQDAIKDAYKEDAFAGRADVYFMGLRGDGKHGLMMSEEDHWRDLRSFTMKVLADFGFGKTSLEGIIQNEIHDFMTSLRKDLGKAINLRGKFNITVVNSLWTIATGDRFNHDDPEMKATFAYIMKFFEEFRLTGRAVIFPYSERLSPWMLGLQTVADNAHVVKSKLKKVIQKHEERRTGNETSDFIHVFISKIESTTDPNSAFYGKTGYHHLLHVLFDFFLAGSETTSISLLWFIMLMCHYPDIQKRVQQEIDSVVGRSRSISLNDMPNMPYSQACVMELHRFASVSPAGVPRRALRTHKLREFVIPEGTWFFTNLWGVHHDPKHWARPNEFNPEHFLTPDGQYKPSDYLMPFSTGKRVCIGEKIATFQIFLLGTTMLQNMNFKFDPSSPKPPLESAPMMVRCPHSYKVIATER